MFGFYVFVIFHVLFLHGPGQRRKMMVMNFLDANGFMHINEAKTSWFCTSVLPAAGTHSEQADRNTLYRALPGLGVAKWSPKGTQTGYINYYKFMQETHYTSLSCY